MSLIISDTSDDDYVNFRKGVDQAAVEYNVDVSFITLYEKDNLAQQMELVRREAADGAGAVILEPVDELECRQYLEENTYGTPIILLGELSPDEEVKGAVHMDWTAAGRKLGEAITAEQSPDLPVWIFADNPYIGKAGGDETGADGGTGKTGLSYTIVPRGTDDTTVPSLKNSLSGQRHGGGGGTGFRQYSGGGGDCRRKQRVRKIHFRAVRRRDDAVPAGSA